jgi:two-component system cell cycle response regulator
MKAIVPPTQDERLRGRDQGRILLVSDDPDIGIDKSILERAGFSIAGVASGAAALVALRKTRPHVIIASVNLRGINCAEFARMILAARDGVPLVLIGPDQSSASMRASAMEIGAFDYFHTPDEHGLLLACIRQLVTITQTIERLRAEADRDYLTGLSNRRRFRTALGHEVERWRRYRTPCSLLLIDIDHLKIVNDTHGHSAGDVVIRHVAHALTELSRDTDTPARLGGEEFALLLSGADEASAFAAAERLRLAVCANAIEGIGVVTVSLGVASIPSHADSERALFAASDAALYRAKREGRNRSCVAEGSLLNHP